MSGQRLTVAEQVVEITKSEIDSNYINSVSYVEEFCLDSSKDLFVAVCEEAEQESDVSFICVGNGVELDADVFVVGYLLCGSYQYEEYDSYLYTNVECVLSQTEYISKGDFPIYLFQSLAVRDEYQGHGVGGKLVFEAIEDESSHLPFFAGAWKRSDDERNISIMEKHAKRVAIVEDYYPDSWDCPVCEERCCCDSVFYAAK